MNYTLIDKYRYIILLFSFLLLIFGNTFYQESHVLRVGLIYINFLLGAMVFFDKKWLRNIIILVVVMTLFLDIFQEIADFSTLRIIHTILYLLFFTLVSREVFNKVLYVKKVSIELLAAALCGFVLLCIISAFLYSFIDSLQQNSFSNIAKDDNVLDNLTYFSFTTMFTLGFGDITPITLVAKRAVMFMGLIGHFYTVFITSIIIGKYLSANNCKYRLN